MNNGNSVRVGHQGNKLLRTLERLIFFLSLYSFNFAFLKIFGAISQQRPEHLSRRVGGIWRCRWKSENPQVVGGKIHQNNYGDFECDFQRLKFFPSDNCCDENNARRLFRTSWKKNLPSVAPLFQLVDNRRASLKLFW